MSADLNIKTMSRLQQIQRMPTSIDNIHESCFRSDGILGMVLAMVERGDSKQTIFDIVEMMKEYPLDTERVQTAKAGSRRKKPGAVSPDGN